MNGRRTRALLQAVSNEIDRLRGDAGMSIRRLATEAQIDSGYLSQILAGEREPSIAVLVAVTKVLGADLSVRVYPTTGPTIATGSRLGSSRS